jgi:hypothetical protein
MSDAASSGFDAVAARLRARAAMIGAAFARRQLLAGRNDPRRWRSAKLLWPLFARD